MNSNDVLEVDPGLGRRERVVAEGGAICGPSLRCDPDAGRLKAPATDETFDQFLIAIGIHQLTRFHGAEVVFFLGSADELCSCAPLHFQAADVIEVAHALIDCGFDRLVPFRLEFRGWDSRKGWQCRGLAGTGGLGGHGLSYGVQLIGQGLHVLFGLWAWCARTAGRRRHQRRNPRRLGLPVAVANADQIGVTAFAHAAVGAVGTRAVVQATDHGPLGFDQGLDFKAQVIEEGLIVLAEGLLVEAVAGEQAHAFEETEAQPGLQPCP